MMTTRQSAAVLLASLLLYVGHVDAHHSDYLVDQSTTIELRGTVVELKLKSPHSTLVIDGTVAHDDHGRIERWEIETLPMGPMLRTLAIRPDTFKPGDVITVIGWRHRDPRFKFAQALAVVAADGTRFTMSAPEQSKPAAYTHSVPARSGATASVESE